MVSARVDGQPELERDLAAQAAHALDVLAGVVVVQLGGAGEPQHDLELGLGEVLRAREHGGLELGVVARRRVRGRTARSRPARAARSPSAIASATSGTATGSTVPRLNASCAPTAYSAPATDGEQAAPDRPERAARPAAASAAERHGDRRTPASRGSAAADGRAGRSRSRWPGSRRRASADRRARRSCGRPAAPARSRRRPRSCPRSCSASSSLAGRPRTSTSGSCRSARGSRSARCSPSIGLPKRSPTSAGIVSRCVSSRA